MTTYLFRHKSMIIVISFILIFFKIISLFIATSEVQAQGDTEDWPRVFIYQNRGDKVCSYRASEENDCIDDTNDIMFKVQLKPDGSGGCFFPGYKTAGSPDNFYIWTLSVNGVTIFTLNRRFFNENCETDIFVLKYSGRILSTPKDFPAPGVHALNIVLADGRRKPSISKKARWAWPANFEVKTLETCLEEGECSDSPSYIDVRVWKICSQAATNQDAFDKCQACFKKDAIWTAIGCIPTNPEAALQTIIKVGLLIGGGVALLIILAGSFILSISQGDPKKTSEAKEMITAALIGLIFIIFSVSILQFIGVQIFQIPEFGHRVVNLPT